MKKPRIKITVPLITTRDEAEYVVGEVATLTIKQIQETAAMDAEIAAVRQRYEANLGTYSEQLKIKSEMLHAWAQTHPEEFPKNRKSIEFVQGTVGFRKGNPTLALASRAFTWDKVSTILQGLRWRKFIRVKREVDKEAILARAAAVKNATKFSSQVLSRIGLKINQDESFYVDPKLTETETRQTVEA